jgi:hypothetical protein
MTFIPLPLGGAVCGVHGECATPQFDAPRIGPTEKERKYNGPRLVRTTKPLNDGMQTEQQ